jgi:hypothetical protein
VSDDRRSGSSEAEVAAVYHEQKLQPQKVETNAGAISSATSPMADVQQPRRPVILEIDRTRNDEHDPARLYDFIPAGQFISGAAMTRLFS